MDTDLDLRHLRYFVAVAEELHFGRAAKRLHLAQPPLSQQIRKLEEIVGCALLTRTSRSVRLTAAGEAYLDRARRILRAVEQDLEEARSIGRGEVGFLRLGLIGSGMLSLLPRTLGEYRKAHPGVHLQLHESFTSQVVHGLLGGALDAGFLRDGGPVPGLVTEPLFSEPFIAVVPATHPRARVRHFTAAALRGDPFVFYSPNAGRLAFEKPISLCEEHGFRPVVVQEASHWMTILSLISAGLGVSIAPACVARIAPPDVVCRRLAGARVGSDVELAYRADEDRAIVESFARVARETSRTRLPPVRLQ